MCFSRASSVPTSPVGHNKLHRSATNPFFSNIPLSKDPPKYDEVVKNKQVKYTNIPASVYWPVKQYVTGRNITACIYWPVKQYVIGKNITACIYWPVKQYVIGKNITACIYWPVKQYVTGKNYYCYSCLKNVDVLKKVSI